MKLSLAKLRENIRKEIRNWTGDDTVTGLMKAYRTVENTYEGAEENVDAVILAENGIIEGVYDVIILDVLFYLEHYGFLAKEPPATEKGRAASVESD